MTAEFDGELELVLKWADRVEWDAGCSGAGNDGGAGDIRALVNAFRCGLRGEFPPGFVLLAQRYRGWERRDLDHRAEQERRWQVQETERPKKLESAKARVEELRRKLQLAFETKLWNRLEEFSREMVAAEATVRELSESARKTW